MTRSFPQEISHRLQVWHGGDEAAPDRFVPRVYGVLRRLAHCYVIREPECHTLQSTGLVNEAYLRLLDANRLDWQDRAHFFAIGANLTRCILVDFTCSPGHKERGGNMRRVSFDESLFVSPEPDKDFVKLDDTLNCLTGFDPTREKTVELRFFGGLNEKEAAEALIRTSRNQSQILLGSQEPKGSVVDGKPAVAGSSDSLLLFRLKVFNFLYSWPPNDEFFCLCHKFY